MEMIGEADGSRMALAFVDFFENGSIFDKLGMTRKLSFSSSSLGASNT
jgi:hypothetical protein